ncbi:MAG: c-type cytochrome, partial [Planctomycetes bacterium]|nr:c-type cytochrome [Planctomycetota bacterium]
MLERQLLSEDPARLGKAARTAGDAPRGALLFHQAYLACAKCHGSGGETTGLGPDLASPDPSVTDAQIVESILQPSRVIKQGFEPVTVVTDEGVMLSGLLVDLTADRMALRDMSQDGKLITLDRAQIAEQGRSGVSIMPAGLANQLRNRQEFLDLVRYLIEIREHGPARAKELRPADSLLAPAPLPEYEDRLDHAGMIADWDQRSFKRGEAIYGRLCINCHGTKDEPGSIPTSLRFASGQFKSGSDPLGMYQTLTKGFGMMAPQTWMVPQQKYDVIHYIREAYLKPHNPQQYVRIDRAYLDRLPKGDTRGPEPTLIEPWGEMNYGPNLIATYEIGDNETNFAYKGIAVRLDDGRGGVARGKSWMLFEHDTLNMQAAWSGEGFIDWNGINFNGRHNIHPRLVGKVHLANASGPAWVNPRTGSFEDTRLRGRDGRPYGPLPRDWAHYRGLY